MSTLDVPPQSGGGPYTLGNALLDSGSAALGSSTSLQTVDAFAVALYRACEYLLVVSQGSAFEVVKLLVLTDGTNTFLETYGAMGAPAALLGVFSATVASGSVVLSLALSIPFAANVKFQATRIFV